MSVANKVKEGADPGSLAEELKQVSTLVAGVAEKYPSPKSGTAKATEPKAGEQTDEDEKKKPKPAFPGAAPPFGSEGAAKTKKDEGEPVEKGGAKMARDRLERFRTALAMMGELLTEIDVPSTAPAPTAGIAETKKSETNPAVAESISKAEQTIASLQAQVKEQKGRIEKLAQVTPAPSSIPVEDRTAPHNRREVSWPLDMNRPLDRESVGKDVSFHNVD
jgi:hypothetical protein